MNQTLLQHFSELKKRLMWTVLCFVGAFIIGWIFTPQIQTFLTDPLMDLFNGAMLYTGLTDGIMIQFHLAMLVALFLTTPFLLLQIWKFVAPGLHKNEKKFIVPILIFSPLLFLTGALFAFFVMFPVAFEFFVMINSGAPVPTMFLPNVKDYLTFSIGLLKIFGIAFQMPLVLILLNKIGVLQKDTIIKSRKYVVVLIFVVSAMLTPPDIVSQTILSVPLLLLFEISLIFMKK